MQNHTRNASKLGTGIIKFKTIKTKENGYVKEPYCDTTGLRLSRADKDLLCKILEKPEKYNGFTTREYIKTNEGKDYNGRWYSTTRWRYRINVNDTISIDEWHTHRCDDGSEQKNKWYIKDIRRIIEILHEIEYDL